MYPPTRLLILGCSVFLLAACGSDADDLAEPSNTGAASAAASRCLTGEPNMHATDDYIGMSEAQALGQAQEASGGRVVERDGVCTGRDQDLRDGRVNLVVVDGRVTYAAVERLP